MKSKIVARIIAVVICIVIYAIYISIAIAMDWKTGGGIIVIAILLGIFRYVWKFAGKIGEEMDSQLQEKDTSTSNHLLEPITEDTQTQEESTISDIEIENCQSCMPNIEVQSSTTENTTQPIQLELNSILNALFTLWILYSFIASLVEFIINVEGDYLIGGLDFAFNLVGIIGTIGLILKKRWGIFLFVIFFLLQFIIYTYSANFDTTYYEEVIKVVMKVVIFIALLFIRKDGYSAWKTIWNNGSILETEEDNQSEQLMLNSTDSKIEKADSSSSVDSELFSNSTLEVIGVQHADIVENDYQNKQGAKTHWKKYKSYYIIGLLLCVMIASIAPMAICIYQKNEYIYEQQYQQNLKNQRFQQQQEEFQQQINDLIQQKSKLQQQIDEAQKQIIELNKQNQKLKSQSSSSYTTNRHTNRSAITMTSYSHHWSNYNATISLKNNTLCTITSVTGRIIYYDMNGNVLDYQDFTKKITIESGFAQSITINGFGYSEHYAYYKSDVWSSKYTYKVKFELQSYKTNNDYVH